MISIDEAKRFDAIDELAGFRSSFVHPAGPDGRDGVYLRTDELGLVPRADVHPGGDAADLMARLVGAEPTSLRATSAPADLADPAAAFVASTDAPALLVDAATLPPQTVEALAAIVGAEVIDTPDGASVTDVLIARITALGATPATIAIGGTSIETGEVVDLEQVVATARNRSCTVGLDLTQRVGNAAVDLDSLQPDVAVWSASRFLCGGDDASTWWYDRAASSGATPSHAVSDRETAALGLIEAAGPDRLHRKARAQTAMLRDHLAEIPGLIWCSPTTPERTGATIVIDCGDRAQQLHDQLAFAGVFVGCRGRRRLTLTPSPLYTSFEDLLKVCEGLAVLLR